MTLTDENDGQTTRRIFFRNSSAALAATSVVKRVEEQIPTCGGDRVRELPGIFRREIPRRRIPLLLSFEKREPVRNASSSGGYAVPMKSHN